MVGKVACCHVSFLYTLIYNSFLANHIEHNYYYCSSSLLEILAYFRVKLTTEKQ